MVEFEPFTKAKALSALLFQKRVKNMTKLLQTRGEGEVANTEFLQALLSPSASFGGLFTLGFVPKIDSSELTHLTTLSYKALCKRIFELLDLGINEGLLESALKNYEKFDTFTATNAPLTLKKYDDYLFISELYHGPTRAFKDMALQPFGSIINSLAKDNKREYLILCATSGDTGPATLEAFADSQNVKVVCLYPQNGTSDVQRLQMVTQKSENLKVIGIEGDFDTAQNALKNLLKDEAFKSALQAKGLHLSAANSVNIGRVVFQIIYHIWNYCELVRSGEIALGEGVNAIVPSGNFGNILGAFYAKKLGIPFAKLISASNPNKILYEFITTGIYNIRNRALIKSDSPAMDILKSSNVERVLFELFGAERTRECMQGLEKEGIYALTSSELALLQNEFGASFCDDGECEVLIKEAFLHGMLIDPHTACGIKAYKEFMSAQECESKRTKFVLCSTAEWSKFAPIVAKALKRGSSTQDSKDSKGFAILDDKEAINSILAECKKLGHENVALHPEISALFEKKISQNTNLGVSQLKESILQWL